MSFLLLGSIGLLVFGSLTYVVIRNRWYVGLMKRPGIIIFALGLVLGALIGAGVGWYFTRPPELSSDPIRLELKLGANRVTQAIASKDSGVFVETDWMADWSFADGTALATYLHHVYPKDERTVLVSAVVTSRFSGPDGKDVEFQIILFQQTKRPVILRVGDGLSKATVAPQGSARVENLDGGLAEIHCGESFNVKIRVTGKLAK